MHPVHTFPHYYLKIYSHIIFPSTTRSSEWFSPFRLSDLNVICICHVSQRAVLLQIFLFAGASILLFILYTLYFILYTSYFTLYTRGSFCDSEGSGFIDLNRCNVFVIYNIKMKLIIFCAEGKGECDGAYVQETRNCSTISKCHNHQSVAIPRQRLVIKKRVTCL
jgi:hypothetical protein